VAKKLAGKTNVKKATLPKTATSSESILKKKLNRFALH